MSRWRGGSFVRDISLKRWGRGGDGKGEGGDNDERARRELRSQLMKKMGQSKVLSAADLTWLFIAAGKEKNRAYHLP